MLKRALHFLFIGTFLAQNLIAGRFEDLRQELDDLQKTIEACEMEDARANFIYKDLDNLRIDFDKKNPIEKRLKDDYLMAQSRELYDRLSEAYNNKMKFVDELKILFQKRDRIRVEIQELEALQQERESRRTGRIAPQIGIPVEQYVPQIGIPEVKVPKHLVEASQESRPVAPATIVFDQTVVPYAQGLGSRTPKIESPAHLSRSQIPATTQQPGTVLLNRETTRASDDEDLPVLDFDLAPRRRQVVGLPEGVPAPARGPRTSIVPATPAVEPSFMKTETPPPFSTAQSRVAGVVRTTVYSSGSSIPEAYQIASGRPVVPGRGPRRVSVASDRGDGYPLPPAPYDLPGSVYP